MKWIFAILMAALSSPAFAGFTEVGASVNYRSSGYNDDNYARSLTYTSSISYYFAELCAWELNYTTGSSEQRTKGRDTADPVTIVNDQIQMVSMDLVFSFAGREDPFRPYIKGGVGYLDKQRFRKINADARESISHQYGMVPSAGVGLSLSLAKAFSIKIGLDAWTSPLNKRDSDHDGEDDPIVLDYAGRAGISFMF